MDTVDKVNNLSKSEFISVLGNIFEKTEWIAEQAYYSKPYNNFGELFEKMMEIFENCKREDHLKILKSHPDLAVEKKLTKDSEKEQANANLNECTEEEFKEFKNLNEKYKKKFGFPFIIAVKGKNKKEILNNFKTRILNSLDIEFKEAKKQVKKIASFRLKKIIY
mgnify:CR=1 FL=1|tara:strand:- start:795 stop:1289 length:495 start_codon:yes stop_codon:yes gene_type:complete